MSGVNNLEFNFDVVVVGAGHAGCDFRKSKTFSADGRHGAGDSNQRNH